VLELLHRASYRRACVDLFSNPPSESPNVSQDRTTSQTPWVAPSSFDPSRAEGVEPISTDTLLASGKKSYLVLARKWRPAQFSDIVGQGHIVRTLSNAIRMGRIHQAYLFTGSRGIGKTSIARIFSKVLRCKDAVGSDLNQGEALRSCDHCGNCREIALGTSVDVREIDGASNNGVEAIREIREDARVLPSSGDRKIFIIDEVHMLTTAAFNALLKLLEEPPAHVLFIFATTEPHKIPATILSRCQRFDYRRVSSSQIQERLALICKEEGIVVEAGVLALIAQAAEGSMRDSLSLLDQVRAFSGDQISLVQTRECVGLISGHRVLDLLEGVFKRKPKLALDVVEQCYRDGQDLRILAKAFSEFMHAAILAKVGIETSFLVELAETEQTRLLELVTHRSLDELELIFQAAQQSLEWIARSPQPKIILDVLLIKCALAENLVPLIQAPRSPSTEASPRDVLAKQVRETPTPIRATIPPTGPHPETTSPQRARPPGVATATLSTPVSGAASPLQELAQSLAKVTPLRSSAPGNSGPVAPKNSVLVNPDPQALPPSTQEPKSHTWESFIDLVRQRRPLLASILEHAAGAELPSGSPGQPGILEIFFKPQDAYFRGQLQSRVYQEQMQNLCKEAFGRPVRLVVESRETGESVAQRRDREAKVQEQSIRSQAENHPILREARTLFGGELGPILLSAEARDV
jgi:DNA polymerase-3 subunit gamma/tau